MTIRATDLELRAMARRVRDAWGLYVASGDESGKVVAGAVVTRLADLSADFGVQVDLSYDADEFWRRAIVTCPRDAWSGSVMVHDELVQRRAWESILGQLERLTGSLREHQWRCVGSSL